ncbi:hypothetical protein HHL17_06600 [Chitinophaga sp. G-6-1-13]|uniref:Uncharacterized protein n=1 Tax=Chitinophaga fulva TaxID=2728842 RepID=A0A848GIG9_9BACT|nr:hypothetical protein [Chitinophaga fulva]NML36862.1 hypothetical protein [Chitinophaga fulva]
MDYYETTFNLDDDMPAAAWEKVIAVYEQLPGWVGFSNGIPFWFGTNENEKHISASVEPSGLLVGAYMAEVE